MYILSVTLIFEISRSKVKILEKVFNLYSYRIIRRIFISFFFLLINLIIFISHPIFFSIMLIIRSIIIGLICIKINLSWFFYLLVLVFLGGVIILIIYINTLAINEKFFFYKIKFKFVYVSLFFIIIQLLFYKNNFIKINFSNYISITLYNSINSIFIVFLIFYLLLTLICVVKLVKFEFGPLIKRLYNLFNNFI